MYSFPTHMRVRTRAEYQRAFDGGVKAVGPGLVLFAMPRPATERGGGTRLGLVVSRKVGNAVARNRVKRYLRETFRHLQHDLKSSTFLNAVDLVVVARPSIVTASSVDIACELDQGLTRLARQLSKRPGNPTQNTAEAATARPAPEDTDPG